MRRAAVTIAAIAFASAASLGAARTARADEPPVDPDAAGVAVVAEGDSADLADVAWPLAQAAYAKTTLRPKYLGESQARALVGEAPAEDASTDVKELSKLRAAVHGDDTVSVAVLDNMGHRLHTKALIILTPQKDGAPTVRLFDVGKKAFDSARWQPDAKDGGWSWDGTVTSIERSLGGPVPVPVVKKPTVLTVVPPPPAKDKSKSFYESPWFWVAVGGAALLGGGIFLATRDWSGDTVHVRMQVPQ